MGEGKWIKTYVNSYDDTPSKMIDARDDRDVIHYIRGRLNALAGKVNRNGELYMTETKPYTIKTLAIEFNRDFEVVKEAVKVLKSLEVIEITEDRVLKISDWEIDQNIEGLERIRKQTSERVARHRAAKKANEYNKLVEEEKKPELPKRSKEDSKGNYEGSKQKLIQDQGCLDEEDTLDDQLDCIDELNYGCDNNVESNASCNGEELNNIEDNIINNNNSENEVHYINEIRDLSSVIDNIDSNNQMLSKDKAENTNDNDSKRNVTVTQQNKRRGKKRSKKKDKRESKKKENSSLIEFSCDSNEFEISDDNVEDLFCESFVSEESGFGDEIGDDNNTIFFDVSESYKPDEQSVTCFEMNGAISCKEQLIKSIEIYNSRDEIGQEVNSFEVSHVRNSNRQTVNSFEVSYAGHNSEEPVSSFKTFDSEYKSEESAKILLKYCNDIVTCIPENITLNALKYAINTHTERYVKMAIDKSMEAGKFNMAYINGILKNWKREGYPNEDSKGESINGTNSYGKGNIQDTGKFEGFKPKEPRKLTEEERKSAEKNLI
ncbi:phage replisome organizer N-terminal domain-containing protein [Clostridium neonatale]|uniref:phage replisome organizer N-terminal domain-containing protein n=1 Tax=Clostridium neonatale TaxID=137838 RepID=UPI0012E51FBC|nr:phage replisome organizer N-terminal domain-containing protein [Clostridium neonatale]SUQ54935.1 hypothetical protein CNEONATNEC86_03830 [Clostridium neonatale]